jgi:hypothetical protein
MYSSPARSCPAMSISIMISKQKRTKRTQASGVTSFIAGRYACLFVSWDEALKAESVEYFIENQVFWPSYDLAPPPPSVSSTGDTQEDRE